MKAVQTLLFLAAICASSALSAQNRLPEAGITGLRNEKDFSKSSMKQLLTTDSLTRSEIQTTLNRSVRKNVRQDLPQALNSKPSPGSIPDNPKEYMEYLEPNGRKLYKPKASLGLMAY